MWFTRVSIANPVMATMVMLAFVVLGLFSYQRLQVDQFPEIEFPVVVVQIDYPGASPEIVETEVTRKVEETVNSIAGIKKLYSRSYDSRSIVIVEFNLDVDDRRAAEDVREKLSALRPALRDEVEEPRVLRFDPASRPIYMLALTSPDGSRGPVELSTYADQVLKKRLENARGVGSVSLVGEVKREINIYLDPQAMEAFGVGVDQVVAAVRTENRDLPAGVLRSPQAELVVQVAGRIVRPEEFAQIIIARRGAGAAVGGAAASGASGGAAGAAGTGSGSGPSASGVPVRLGLIARIVDGPQEIESLALYNGQRMLALSVLKAQRENTIDVVDGLNRAVDDLRTRLPEGMQLDVVSDNSRPIRVAVSNVRQTLLEGAALTILIVFLFLNSWRSTVITGLTLPIALIGSFLFMYAFGFSINMITLMALSLCVGLLIDDAIVVRENIVRHVQMGKDARRAALEGTHEIGLAVLATTLSIVAVFLPIGFMGGIIGKFFHEFGITIVAAVLISMFVSFTLDPMLSSVWHDPAIHRQGAPGGRATLYDRTLGRLTALVERFSRWLGGVYEAVLGWSLRHKLATLALALASLLGSFGLLPLLGTEFVPRADFGETNVSFHTPTGSSLEVTEARAQQVDRILHSFPEVDYTVTTINTGSAPGRNEASLYVRLVDRAQRARSVDELSVPLRERLARVPGIVVTQVGLLDAVGGQKPIQLSIQGDDLTALQRLTERLLPRLREVPGLVDLDTSMKPSKPTVDVVVRREAASDLGLSVGSITSSLRALVAGDTIGNWRAPNDESYDVRVSLAPASRNNRTDLERLGLVAGQNADGSPRVVRLAQVASLAPSFGADQINRRDLNREVEITANVSGRALGEVSADIREVLQAFAFPPGYRASFGGSAQDMQESFGYALSALALAVIFIYMILASQFRSFLQPIALMSSLPLTLIGVALVLLLFRSTVNLFSIIGVVMLMGLVTKNAILLVDFANRAREGRSGEHVDGESPDAGEHLAGESGESGERVGAESGEAGSNAAGRPLSRDEALLMAARVRLRPIMMTTLAMVFGMLPLAFAVSEGSEQRAPMGQAVIGGVITSSLLTLVVVPVVYCYLDDLSGWMKRKWRGRQKAGSGAGAVDNP